MKAIKRAWRYCKAEIFCLALTAHVFGAALVATHCSQSTLPLSLGELLVVSILASPVVGLIVMGLVAVIITVDGLAVKNWTGGFTSNSGDTRFGYSDSEYLSLLIDGNPYDNGAGSWRH